MIHMHLEQAVSIMSDETAVKTARGRQYKPVLITESSFFFFVFCFFGLLFYLRHIFGLVSFTFSYVGSCIKIRIIVYRTFTLDYKCTRIKF